MNQREMKEDLAMSEPNEKPQPKSSLRERDAAELTEPLKARAAKARERAQHKMTAQEVLANREAKARAKAQARVDAGKAAPTSTGAKVAVVLGVGLLLGAGACLSIAQRDASTAAIASSSNSREIALLRAEVARLGGLETVGDGGVDAVRGALSEVRKVAEQVADEQNEFAALLAANPDDPGNGAPSQGFLDSVENRRDMVKFFDPATFVVPADEIFSPTSLLTIEADQVDPRMPWYSRDVEAGAASWQVGAVRAGDGEGATTTEVLWLCRDETSGDLLAWARAAWPAEGEVFTSLTVGTTSLGDASNAVRPWADESIDDINTEGL